jgi:hypothetical protein
MHLMYGNQTIGSKYRPVPLLIIIILAGSSLILANHFVGKAYGQPETNFPPPVFYQLRDEPSYLIDIPFSSAGLSSYDPPEISIPTGMTVIWFNDDDGDHSVTTISNETYTAPESFDSGPILTDGGSFVHAFDKPGVYHYYDTFNPSAQGTINVGGAIEEGKNMNMMIGGDNAIPFNSSKPQGVVLSFVPKTVTFPPDIALTYNVSLLNPSTGKVLFTDKYDDSDGILDLELVPSHAGRNASHFITWGSDL